ncbi:MAG: hypothetical protein QF512_15440, partial [Alphaproteobacteria bacterium]|nr:hypothetical protein [Alphaproteobacteria bacterium]
FFIVTTLFILTGCLGEETTWYEDRCLHLGIDRGSADFDKCIERDQRWVNEIHTRAQRERAP